MYEFGNLILFPQTTRETLTINKQQRKPEQQSRMHNPETLAHKIHGDGKN